MKKEKERYCDLIGTVNVIGYKNTSINYIIFIGV
jgi:hypothetical protein